MNKSEYANLKRHQKLKILLVGIALTACAFLFDALFITLMTMIQHPVAIYVLSFVTLIGNIEVILPLAFIVAVILYFRKKDWMVPILSVAAAGVLSTVIKIIVERPRPFETFDVAATVATSLSSFPSGHTMVVFSLVPVLIMNFPRFKVYLFSVAVLVAFSRIYLNVHYLSDVVAGAFIGYLIGMVVIELVTGILAKDKGAKNAR